MENKIVYSNTNSARDMRDNPKKNISGISMRSEHKDEIYGGLAGGIVGGITGLAGNNFNEDNLYKQYKNNLWNSPSTNKKENPVLKKNENDQNVMEMTASIK